MARRTVRLTTQDRDLVKPLLQSAYLQVEVDDRMVETYLATDGLHTIDSDPTRPIYCHLVPRTVDEPIGPVPVGLATQIGTLVPQYLDRAWVDSKLAPLLAQSLRTYAAKYPDWRQRPFFGVGPYALAVLWDKIFYGKAVARYGDTMGIIWLPTLEEALERAAAI